MDDLLDWVDDPDAGWSVGTFGALAEFLRDPDEPADVVRAPRRASVVTPRGGVAVALTDDVLPVAWERRAGESWSQAVALCLLLPSGGRSVITELGHDHDELRDADRDAVLVDLGVGAPHLEACVRTSDASLLAELRAVEGRPLAEAGHLAAALVEAGPHRVFRTGVDPVELYITIAALGFFYLSNRHTLSTIFGRDLAAPKSIAAREQHIVDVVLNYLKR